MIVKDVMNKAIVVEDNINVRDAAKIMSDKGIGCLTIMKKDKIAGIITERDIMKNIGRLGEKISNIMSKNVIKVDKNESLESAARIMSENKIKRLPVMHKGELVGIITATDILANSDSLNEVFLVE